MSKKEKENKQSTQSVFTKETAGVVFALFSALCLVMLITGDKVFGDIGAVIDAFLYGAFGKFTYAVVIYGLIGGSLMIAGKKTGITAKRKFFITLAFMCVAALFHVLSVGAVAEYSDYLNISYEMGAQGFSAASAGGFFTALYAFFFSKLTVAGGAVVSGLLAALCVYVVISDAVKKNKTAVKEKEEKFKGSFVEEAEEPSLEASRAETFNRSAEYTDTVQPLRDAEPPRKTARLFVNDAEAFAFKTKRESKQKNSPSIKIESASNGLTVGHMGVSYSDARVDDYQRKIEYIKMPASINLDKSEKDKSVSQTIGSQKTVSNTVVSDYITDSKPVKEKEENKPRVIPMYEHDGNNAVESDNVEERAKEFERRYLDSDFKPEEVKIEEPQDIFRPRTVSGVSQTDRTFELPNERVQEQSSIAYSGKEETESVVSPRRTDRASLFDDSANDNRKATDDKDNVTESIITKDRNIKEMLFGGEDKKEAAAVDKNETAFTSRVEKDGNSVIPPRESLSGSERIPSRITENVPDIEEIKEEKKLPPINREYHRPPLDLLESYAQKIDAAEEDHEGKLEIIRRTLEEFHISVEPHGFVQGPSITRYEVNMPAGISVKNILKFDDDLRMRLASKNGVRIEAPIPGKNLVGIEVANKHRITVGLKEVLEGAAGRKTKKGELIFALGKDIVGNAITDNLAKGPHFLVAGATGSGKSVCLNVMLVSMIMRYSPEDLRLILIDPKRVGFRIYEHLPHLLIDEIITEPQRCLAVLAWAYIEMERRYELFEKCETVVSDINAYNEYVERTAKNTVPRLARIVIVVDELADLMETCKKDLDARIRALAAKARAAGIHLVLATQRPSVDVITGTIKANLPSRIALKVMNFTDSQTILSEAGAEKLLGNGDMLYKNSAMPECERYQGAWISDAEINNIVAYIIENNEAYFDDELAAYLDKETKPKQEESSTVSEQDDGEFSELFLNSLALGITSGSISISQIQRRYQVGYARAGGIIDKMERMGFISGNEGSKARKVFITRDEYETRFGPMPENP